MWSRRPRCTEPETRTWFAVNARCIPGLCPRSGLIAPPHRIAVLEQQLTQAQIVAAAQPFCEFSGIPEQRLARAGKEFSRRERGGSERARPAADGEPPDQGQSLHLPLLRRGFGGEQSYIPRLRRCLRHSGCEVSAGYGPGADVLRQHVAQDRTAVRPFPDELRPVAVGHAERVRARVAADPMTAARELP